MSVTRFIRRPARLGPCQLKVAVAAIVLVIALPASATATSAVASGNRSQRSRAPTLASVLRPLTLRERRYVLGITSLTPVQLWAAFGTSPTPPTTTSPPVASPILPACGPGTVRLRNPPAALRHGSGRDGTALAIRETEAAARIVSATKLDATGGS